MTTRKQSAAAKAKQEKAKAEATEAQPQEQAEPVPEAAADAVAPSDEQEAPASAAAAIESQGETITGDGTGKALPPIEEMPGEEMPGVFVRTKRRIKSRRRAGYRFNREGTGIALELLSEEQLQQLRDDPALEVEDCTFPLAEATSEPEA